MGSKHLSKRVAYLAADKLIVYHCYDGRLGRSFVFDADGDGLACFGRYLRETPNAPVYFLVDVVEEEYRQENLPHVFGSDRQAMFERKQARLFRGTPYCHAIPQGRQSEGRRDDIVLFTALTNPDLLAPWLGLMNEHKTPLAGIYSLPLLTKDLLTRYGVKSGYNLVVTLHSASGLRQSFFDGVNLKISRLAKMPRLGTVPFGDYLLGELEKVRRYLNSLRLLPSDAALDIYFLSHGQPVAELQESVQDAEQTRYHLIELKDAAKRIGMKDLAETPYADALFAHLLLKSKEPNHYGAPGDTRYFRLNRVRAAMHAASLLLLLGSAIWSGINFIEGMALKEDAASAADKATFYHARYEMARKDLPPTPVSPENLKTAVDIAETIRSYKTNPWPMFLAVSHALDGYSMLHVDGIDWTASVDPDAAVGREKPAAEQGLSKHRHSELRHKYRFYQIALVSGHVEPFDGNYRHALASIDRLAAALRKEKNVARVEVVSMPLDTSSESTLHGSADEKRMPEAPKFALKVVLGIGSEAG